MNIITQPRVRGLRRQWKSDELAGLKPTIYDWCRLAAFIDGEGNLNINHCSDARPRNIIRVLIANTNQDLVLWLSRTFGGVVTMRVHNNPKWKPAFVWACSAARAAWVIHNSLPWMLLKNKQAALLLELQEDLDKTRQSSKHEGISLDSIALRQRIGAEVKRLNAKGPAAQEETTRG